MERIPDEVQVHVIRIRDALWKGREFGHAAVMVGAGMSLNADRSHPTAAGFPTWSELGGKLFDELNPDVFKSDRQEALRLTQSVTGILELKERVVAAFGGEALEEHLEHLATSPSTSWSTLGKWLSEKLSRDSSPAGSDAERTPPKTYSGMDVLGLVAQFKKQFGDTELDRFPPKSVRDDLSRIGKPIVKKLYPALSGAKSDREQALASSGVVRLAEEYVAAFGRDALDEFLIREISDESHEPGDLHRRLLELPWADVFTTNYDTLLERGSKGLFDRKYEPVQTVSDIPGTRKPRIVKLNGTFPSTRPFIFTEEDFRTYPRRFAPFVNLAQQSIMENVFCLIGFSGEDPNFLYWTGWVRDNLGMAAPQIYLCGLLPKLTDAKRNLLHDRNVVPIDLSPRFPIEKFPDPAERQKKALEWLLLSLEHGKPPNRMAWPDLRKPTTQRSMGLPRPLEAEQKLTRAEKCPLSPDELQEMNRQDIRQQVEDLVDTWKNNRKLYPGWLVAPYETWEPVWDNTERWKSFLLVNLRYLPLPLRLRLLYELNWRFELCLMPIDKDFAKAIKRTLNQINPFEDPDLPGTKIRSAAANLKNWSWPDDQKAWVDLAFALLRFARESQDNASFKKWKNSLDKIELEFPCIHSRLRYESCLLALGQMDHVRVQKILSEWRPSEHDPDPFWAIRFAALHAEIGLLHAAKGAPRYNLTS